MNTKAFYEVVNAADGSIVDRFCADDTTEEDVMNYTECAVLKEEDYSCYDIYYVVEEQDQDGQWNLLSDDIIASYDNKGENV